MLTSTPILRQFSLTISATVLEVGGWSRSAARSLPAPFAPDLLAADAVGALAPARLVQEPPGLVEVVGDGADRGVAGGVPGRNGPETGLASPMKCSR